MKPAIFSEGQPSFSKKSF